MALKLVEFRTQNFRSVEDSGWVKLDDVTALVGINESGKSNLLLSLWKLNPAREGAIDPVPDFPRDRYHELRAMTHKPVFISAKFKIGDELAKTSAAKTGLDVSNFKHVVISRKLSGKYSWHFPDCKLPTTVSNKEVVAVLNSGKSQLEGVEAFQTEGDLKERMLEALALSQSADFNGAQLNELLGNLDINREAQAKSSKLGPIYDDVLSKLKVLRKKINLKEPTETEGIWDLYYSEIPKFVYYSNYGNLDSEIYLPHVIDNLEREDLGESEAAKARTLRVLFDFVNLSPQEIMDLGSEANSANLTPEAMRPRPEIRKNEKFY